MRHSVARLGVLVGAVVLAGCASAGGRGSDDEGQSLIRRWEQAAATRNADTLAAIYASDAVGMYAEAPARMGRDSIRVTWANFFNDLYLDIAPRRVDVSATGDMAYATGRYQIRSGSPTGDLLETGKYLQIWKKMNGQWMVVAEMNNSDAPTP